MKTFRCAAPVILSFLLYCAGCFVPESGRSFAIQNEPGRAHVILVPGILGENSDWFRFKSSIEHPIDRRNSGRIPYTAQIWDWTKHESLAYQPILRGLNEGNIRRVSAVLAEQVRLWKGHRESRRKRLYVVAGSGGCLITYLACRRLPEKTFERVILLCPSMRKTRDTQPLRAASRDGVFSYYSSNDDVLQKLNDSVCGWPPAGLHGFSNPRGVRQLAWQDHSWAETHDNDGRHLQCLSPDYAQKYLLPLLRGNVPGEWK